MYPEQMMALVSELDSLALSGLSVRMSGNYKFMVDGFFKHGELMIDLENKTIYCRYDLEVKFEYNDLTHTLLKLASKLCKESYGKDANYLDYYNWRTILDRLD